MMGFGLRRIVMSLVLGLGGIIATGHIVQAEELTVATSPSLRAAFREIVPMFEREYGATLRVEYGPSQTQRRHIEKGAPIDVFLPAAIEEAQKLHEKGLTLNGEPRVYAQTSLVLIMSATSRAMVTSFHDVAPHRGMRIVLGDPQTSALGEVTARTLRKYDPAYKSRFQLHYAQHGENIVDLVQNGQAELGIVYRTDAISNGQVRIVDEAPAGATTRVRFGEAIVWTCRQSHLGIAKEFVDFMASPRIQKLLLKYGFDPVPMNG